VFAIRSPFTPKYGPATIRETTESHGRSVMRRTQRSFIHYLGIPSPWLQSPVREPETSPNSE